ncbi:putative thioredoxin-like ferredoxin, Thioredoxin-like superfamily [Helianthus annuus]|nr:putative thioredoxin-like ferredoxin, Thioredoxin-like superfamily [Helianthus annuus]
MFFCRVIVCVKISFYYNQKVLAGALKARKNDIPVKTLLTICKGREGTELSDGDVGLKESDINSFVDEVVVNRKLWSAGVQETMTGSHVFVCSHSSRDKRCGFCGPILIKKFKEEAELRGLDNVYGCVTPSDVPELLDNHIVKGEIIDRIWRYNFTIFVFSFSKLLFICLQILV